MCDSDILQEVSELDLPKLREIYKKDLPRNVHVYNYLGTVIEWKKKSPDSKYMTVFVPNGKWEDGTFIGINQYPCFELLMSAKEENCESLCRALIETKIINWSQSMLLYALYTPHYPNIMETLSKTAYKFYSANFCDTWWIPKSAALEFEVTIPEEVYVKELNREDAVIIDSSYPHSHPGSVENIITLIEMSGGFGVFLKNTNKLVSWVLLNIVGLGTLATIEAHKRKGYASLIIKIGSKEIAKRGNDPVATILQKNTGSQKLFSALGFKPIYPVAFVENKEMRDNH